MGNKEKATEYFNKGLLLMAKELTDSELKEANTHFVEALRLGGLSIGDENKAHFMLGGNYFRMLKFSECVEHYEQLLKSDPKFESFEVKTRDRAKGTVFNELAIAYGENAKNLNDRSGSQTAINYLENKIQILGDKNPPSIYVTLGGFYGLQNKHDKAKDIFNKAIEAPTYGSNLQMDSLKNAQEFSKRPELAESKHFRGSWKVMLFFILAALVGLIMAFSGETSAGIVNLLFWGIVAFMYWKRKSR